MPTGYPNKKSIAKGRKRTVNKAKEEHVALDTFGASLAAIADVAYSRGYAAGLDAALREFKRIGR